MPSAQHVQFGGLPPQARGPWLRELPAIRRDYIGRRLAVSGGLVVCPRDLQEPPVGKLHDGLFPREHVAVVLIQNIEIRWPRRATVERDERDGLHAVGRVAVPALPGSRGPKPAAVAQHDHRVADLEGRPLERRFDGLRAAPRVPAVSASQHDQIDRYEAQRIAVYQAVVVRSAVGASAGRDQLIGPHAGNARKAGHPTPNGVVEHPGRRRPRAPLIGRTGDIGRVVQALGMIGDVEGDHQLTRIEQYSRRVPGVQRRRLRFRAAVDETGLDDFDHKRSQGSPVPSIGG